MMKNLLLTSVALLSTGFFANAQCKVVSDSVIAGAQATQHSTYYYDIGLKIVAVETIDSNETAVTRIDSLFYDGSDQLTDVDTWDLWGGSPSLYGTTDITYNGSGQITKIAKWGDNGNGPWTMAHDLTYNGSGELVSIVLDPFSITGQPEGFMANFENMAWTNGNLTYVELIGDLGGGSIDTLELVGTYDTYSSLEGQLYVDEAPDMIGYLSTNNILNIAFANDEAFGNAGTIALQYSYTYDGNRNVATRADMPGIFEEELSTYQYNWDCALPGVGVDELENSNTTIFPNPFSNSITIQSDDFEIRNADIRISDLNGRTIVMINGVENGNTIDLSDLDAGMYLITVSSKAGQTTKRIIKE